MPALSAMWMLIGKQVCSCSAIKFRDYCCINYTMENKSLKPCTHCSHPFLAPFFMANGLVRELINTWLDNNSTSPHIDSVRALLHCTLVSWPEEALISLCTWMLSHHLCTWMLSHHLCTWLLSHHLCTWPTPHQQVLLYPTFFRGLPTDLRPLHLRSKFLGKLPSLNFRLPITTQPERIQTL
jgi:hypothetical protein